MMKTEDRSQRTEVSGGKGEVGKTLRLCDYEREYWSGGMLKSKVGDQMSDFLARVISLVEGLLWYKMNQIIP